MNFKNNGGEIFIPDNIEKEIAIKRTTHMAIGAHQDDLEIMAYDGINKCFGMSEKWFLGVVVTNGAGSARSGIYSNHNDEEMQLVRKLEQKKAAYVGEYGAQILLDYPSSAVKSGDKKDLVEEMSEIIEKANPKILYTHNLADKHDTHIGTALRVIEAIRKMPFELRPKKVIGCEVWRDLDWIIEEDKVVFDVDSHSNIASALIEVFDSQICGGKRYDMATSGRRLANATYAAQHSVDSSKALIYGMNLTPLIEDETLDISEYVTSYIDRFKTDVKNKISKFL